MEIQRARQRNQQSTWGTQGKNPDTALGFRLVAAHAEAGGLAVESFHRGFEAGEGFFAGLKKCLGHGWVPVDARVPG